MEGHFAGAASLTAQCGHSFYRVGRTETEINRGRGIDIIDKCSALSFGLDVNDVPILPEISKL